MGSVMIIYAPYCVHAIGILGSLCIFAIPRLSSGIIQVIMRRIFCCTLIVSMISLWFLHCGFFSLKHAHVTTNLTFYIHGFICLMLLSIDALHRDKILESVEYYPLLLAVSFGGLVALSAQNGFLMFLGIELNALPLYVLIAMNRTYAHSIEGGVKYFMLSALSSTFFLFGLSLLYACGGTLEFAALKNVLHEIAHKSSELNLIALSGFACIMLSIAFKLGLAPVHFWMPDIYQATPFSLTLIWASVNKVLFMMVFIRLIYGPLHSLWVMYGGVSDALALVSIIWGACATLAPKSIKRTLAYAAVYHMGCLALGLPLKMDLNLVYVVLYGLVDALISLGVLTVLGHCASAHIDLGGRQQLIGLGASAPLLAGLLTIFLITSASWPPFAGFFIKYGVLMNIVSKNWVYGGIVLLASVISSVYVIRLIRSIYFVSMASHMHQTHMTTGISMKTLTYSLTVILVLSWFLCSSQFIHNVLNDVVLSLN